MSAAVAASDIFTPYFALPFTALLLLLLLLLLLFTVGQRVYITYIYNIYK